MAGRVKRIVGNARDDWWKNSENSSKPNQKKLAQDEKRGNFEKEYKTAVKNNNSKNNVMQDLRTGTIYKSTRNPTTFQGGEVTPTQSRKTIRINEGKGIEKGEKVTTTKLKADKSANARARRETTLDKNNTVRQYMNSFKRAEKPQMQKMYRDDEKRNFKKSTGLSANGYLPTTEKNAQKSREETVKRMEEPKQTMRPGGTYSNPTPTKKTTKSTVKSVNKTSSRGATMADKTANNRSQNQNPAWYYGRNTVKNITVRNASEEKKKEERKPNYGGTAGVKIKTKKGN